MDESPASQRSRKASGSTNNEEDADLFTAKVPPKMEIDDEEALRERLLEKVKGRSSTE